MRNKSSRRQFWLPLAILLLVGLFPMPLTNRLDLLAYDLLSHRLGGTTLPVESVVIAIDDASLQALGPWPWPRQRYAALLKKLEDAPPAVSAFAVLFDPTTDQEAETLLADQLMRSNNVIFPVLPAPAPDGSGIVALRAAVKLRQHVSEGHVDVEIDTDGQTRRLFLEAGTTGRQWPALALAALRRMPAMAQSEPSGRAAPSGPNINLNAWQRDREILLRNDMVGEIPTLSFADVLKPEFAAAALRGKAVFIGVTASGASGALAMANTRENVPVPAVEYHARTFEALRGGAVIRPLAPYAALPIGILLLLAGLLIGRRIGHHRSLFLLGLALLPAGTSFLLLHVAGLWVPPVAAGLALIALALNRVWQQISEFEEADSLLRRRTRIAMDSIADGVVVIDKDGRIEQANHVSARLLGHMPSELQGKACSAFLGASDHLMAGIEECLTQNRSVVLGDAINLPVTPPRTVRVSIGPVSTGNDGVRGAVLVLSDITPLVQAENRLKHQASHDPLTGLPNRTLIQDRLQQLLAGMQRRHASVIVLFLDLDRFKLINDGAGHQVGDAVLCVVSDRLRNACRAEDTVGRWGGDEFVIVLSGDEAVDYCQPVARKLISEMSETITIGDSSYHLGASIGIACAPADSEKAEELVRLADLAMYRAKMAGGNRFAFVSPDMNRASSQRLALEVDLRKALKRGEFEVQYQPQVSIDSHRLTGLEALIRWNRSGHEQIPPDQFIPIAEESGLINEIGAWVLDTVGRHISEWRAAGAHLVPVAINVSARQCQDLTLVELVSGMLKRYAIPPSQIEIEITETAAVQNVEHMARLLHELANLGVKLAIDDFGTGYSSLAHLKSLPISVLKIDKSFVAGTPGNHEDRSISRATIALAHSLGMTVVAEGVENEQQRAFLDTEDCDVAQGFLFSRPISVADTQMLLQQPPGVPPDFSI